MKNIAALAKTKAFYPDARLIRDSFVVRGKRYINFGTNLTVGYRCQFEANGKHDGKCLIIGNNVNIGHEVRIQCVNHIDIGDNVLIGSRVLLIDHSHGNYSGKNQDSPLIPPNDRKLSSAPISIGDNVWIGENSVIQQGVTVGSGSIIAANTIVTKDVEENVIVGGMPARVIKRYDKESGEWKRIE